MAKYLEIHPKNPQERLIKQVVNDLSKGAIAAIPTDSSYALVCRIGDKAAQERIAQIRQFNKNHHFTLLCADLSELGIYAQVSNSVYRLLKAHTPGPYTFLLLATKEVPKRLENPKRKTIGLRVPDYPITHAILRELGEPLLSVTLILPPENSPLTDPHIIREKLDKLIDIIVDGGECVDQPTSVISLEQGIPEVIREGRGDVSAFIA